MTLKACICSSGLQVRDDRNADGIGARLCAAFALAVACAFAFLLPLAPDAAYGAEPLTAANVDLQLAAQGDSSAPATNSSVTDAKTPRSTEDASLLWSVKFTKGYVSPGVIVDDAIIVTSGRGKNGVISKLDRKTGKVIAEAAMHYSSTYSLIAPTYADGKVFVTLTNGAMEAFDAKTLQSLWYYQHEDGGQGNCQVVYSDGLVYTGYWSGEENSRSFVCLDAQTGKLVWERANKGGYYWVGALAVGDYLLFGCDDGEPEGETGTSYVRCVDKRTGEVVSSVEVAGDQRSSIAYDPDLGRIYFTSKPGYLYSAKLDAQTGSLSGLLSLSVGSSTTATPAVHDGRVYVGASSGSFSEGTLSVVDASSLKMLYQLGKASGIGGTVKSTPLVSTAYAGDGKLYLYLTVNYPPGGITMVSVNPDSTEASQAKVIELFTPPSEMQQYCIASVICDEDGNLYYRNDSNYLMCVGPKGADPGGDDDPSGDDPSGDDPSGDDPSGDDPSDDKPSGDDPSGDDPHDGGGSGGDGSGGNGSGGNESPDTNGSDAGGSSSAQRNTPIQYGGNPAGSGGTSSRTGATGTAGTGSGTSTNGSATTATSNDDKNDGRVYKDTGSDSTRHTDSVAATNHLGENPDQGTPDWFVPAIVAIVALAGLAAAFVARMLLASRSSDDDE